MWTNTSTNVDNTCKTDDSSSMKEEAEVIDKRSIHDGKELSIDE